MLGVDVDARLGGPAVCGPFAVGAGVREPGDRAVVVGDEERVAARIAGDPVGELRTRRAARASKLVAEPVTNGA